ncbi:MAG: hypothetical protein Q7U04_09450 [Bacteriovorax sp.]|nr:hypothetical protein [Bacteriovorax sp.]
MKKTLLLACLTTALITILSNNLLACDIHGRTGFLLTNKLSIPVDQKSTGGLSEVQFNQVMDKMVSLYSGMVATSGAKFVLERRWTDPTVNAVADQDTPGVFTITMYGGLARHPEVTPDAMALVACHELGHHLGGAPKKAATGKWASNEGQADYWGTMKCLRHYFDGDNQEAALKNLYVPTIVSTKCNLQYSNSEEQLVCQRMAMAGASIGKLFNAISKDSVISSFTTPDNTVVSRTFNDHPKTQCRLDTFLQASLCDHTIAEAVSETDVNIGVCSLKNGDKIGNRPTCWFKQ